MLSADLVVAASYAEVAYLYLRSPTSSMCRRNRNEALRAVLNCGCGAVGTHASHLTSLGRHNVISTMSRHQSFPERLFRRTITI